MFGKNQRIAIIAIAVIIIDQITKKIVFGRIEYNRGEIEIIPGFFKLVNWGNTGAAWSFMSGNNHFLAIVSLLALLLLFIFRHHFDTRNWIGQTAMGLLFGGITGNIIDRLFVHHVIDFLRFYIMQRGGGEVGFPAFNIADTAICTGVGLLFILAYKAEQTRVAQPAPERP
jgi:signal peptidase II